MYVHVTITKSGHFCHTKTTLAQEMSSGTMIMEVNKNVPLDGMGISIIHVCTCIYNRDSHTI